MPEVWNDPLEKLAAAHRRLEENLNDLARAARTLNDARSREEALEMISGVITYFERSVIRHEEDEERSLFPRLAVLEPIAPTIARLRQEHTAHGRAVDEGGRGRRHDGLRRIGGLRMGGNAGAGGESEKGDAFHCGLRFVVVGSLSAPA